MAKKSYRVLMGQIIAGTHVWNKGDTILPEEVDFLHASMVTQLLKADPPGLEEIAETAPAAAPGG